MIEKIKAELTAGRAVGPVHISEEEYRTFPALSRSQLAQMVHNREIVPAYFQYAENHKEESDALLYGAALHELILEPHKFDDDYAVFRNDRFNRSTKAGKEAWADFVENAGNKKILMAANNNGHNFEMIQGMASALKESEWSMLVRESKHEESWFWVDEITGLWLKCRTDMRVVDDEGAVMDYKSCTDASPVGFAIDCKKYNYDLQAAWYSEGVEKCLGVPYDFGFLAQEKKEPYLSNFYTVPEEMYEDGERMMRTLLGIYKQCLDTGNWYGYSGVFGGPTELKWFQRGGEGDA